MTIAEQTIDSSTGARVKLLAVVLGVAAVAAAVGGLLWPEAEGGGETYSYIEIAADRELWWGLLGGLAAMAVVSVPLQAIATMFLVRARGSAVVEAVNNDQGHLFAFLVIGAFLVVLGTVLQCVGLFRARVVPVWVPVALLFTLLTFIVPGDGALGLVTSIPMAVGAIGLGYYASRRGVGMRPRSRILNSTAPYGRAGHGAPRRW